MMCITGGGAIAQPPDQCTTPPLKPRRGEIIFGGCYYLAPAGLWELEGSLSGGYASLHRRLCTSRPMRG
ncbi:MAG: hypothetical protein LBL62_08875 [Planctomycetaceae bacterium]|nr:hypothetical protein [Planctomycetaceae bacterium]